jgi:maltooligosyltrehalose trehalohydrolase
VGNRAFGERINTLATPEAVKALTALLLLAPFPPLLFMGQEWGSTQPFPFFCDFSDDLATSVREGRRREFAHFPEFSDPAARERIPDPTAPETFASAVLDWARVNDSPGKQWLELYQPLLKLRQQRLVPKLAGILQTNGECLPLGERALQVCWRLGEGSELTLLANLGESEVPLPAPLAGEVLFALPESLDPRAAQGKLPSWAVLWLLKEPETAD